MRIHIRSLSIGLSLFAMAVDAHGQAAQQAYLKASNTSPTDFFGGGVAVSGDTAVVGAYFAFGPVVDSGTAYVFVRSGTTWTQQAILNASNADISDLFGQSVGISGDTIVVGAISEDSSATGVNGDQSSDAMEHAGAAYVFVRSGTTWTQQAYLKASNSAMGDGFGRNVAIAGDTIVVCAAQEDSAAAGVNGDQANNSAVDAGAVYVFTRQGTTWSQQAYLKASNPDAGDRFGWDVDVSGDTIVVGAWAEKSSSTGINSTPNNAFEHAGAAYIFAREGSTWSQQAYLKASNTDVNDQYGDTVAVSGDTVVVGAGLEDSSATGVNGNQSNNSVSNSGAVYVYVRSGTTWSQQAYLKAPSVSTSDTFGDALDISGDRLLIGSPNEDSAATGVNGNHLDNSHTESGAAYLFVRTGGNWTQLAYFKASTNDLLGLSGGDRFSSGGAVAIDDGTILVGSDGEDSAATGVNGNQSDNSMGASGAAYAFELTPSPWVDLGQGLAGFSGVPQLVGTGALAGGDPVALTLSNAKPSSSAVLVLGFSILGAPFMGGTLVPSPDLVVPGLPTNVGGGFVLPSTWPTGVPSGFSFVTQIWITDSSAPVGFAATNAVQATSP